MFRAIFTLSIVGLIPVPALAASLPLQDGAYTRAHCDVNSYDFSDSFDIQTATEGRDKGHRFLYPQAEGQEGACTTGKIDVKGNTYSGAAKCEGGGSRIQYSTGIYHFSLQVVNDKTFMSKGRKYVWCASHR